MAVLTFLSGPAAGLRCEIAGQLTLGRSRACDVALEDDQVSRQHARIEQRQGELRIRDLGSRNGTRVNGRRITAEVALLDGDRIQLGTSTARVELERLATAPAARVDLRQPIESLLAEAGALADLLALYGELLAGASSAAILRSAAGYAVRALRGSGAGFLLRGGLALENVGQAPMDAPQPLLQQALDRGELIRSDRLLCIPITNGERERFGVICVDRAGELGAEELKAAAVLARLAGEALAALRRRTPTELPVLIGTAPTFRRALERVAAAAALNEPLTLFGEAGTGRTLFARYLHGHSPRSGGPLILVNCSAPDEAKAALLGSEGGGDRPSALMRADGGTLVLRHVELLPRTLGQHLARSLRDGRMPTADGGRRFEVRTIALGRDPLEILAAQRRVPDELAEAIAGVAIEVPPLRDRSSDVAALFNFFAHEHSRYLGREPPRLSAGARRALVAYSWPGNLAELRLLAERLALLCPGLEISVARLLPELAESKAAGTPVTLSSRVRALERAAIAEALSAAGGKKIRAAQLLGISRPTLDKKLKELHLAWSAPLEQEG